MTGENEMQQSRPLHLRLLSGGTWTLFGRLVTVLAGFAANALIARMIPAEQVGVYFLLVSLVMVGFTFAMFGMHVTVVRLVAQAMARGAYGAAKAVVETVLGIAILTSCILGIAIGVGGERIAIDIFNSPAMAGSVWYASLWLVALVLLSMLAESFRGFHDFRYATIFSNNTSTNILTAALLGLALLFHPGGDLHSILSIVIASHIISVVLAGGLMLARLKGLGTRDTLPVRTVLSNSFPLVFSSASLYLLTQVDLWIIGMFTTGQDVAAYGAAIRLGQLVYMPLLISNTLLPPFIAEMYSLGKVKELETVIRTASTFSALSAGVMLAVFVLWAVRYSLWCMATTTPGPSCCWC